MTSQVVIGLSVSRPFTGDTTRGHLATATAALSSGNQLTQQYSAPQLAAGAHCSMAATA